MNIPEKELKKITDVLSRMDSGYLPLPIFLALQRLVVNASVETVPFYINGKNNLQICLTKRSQNDSICPEMWHILGSVLLPNDKENSLKVLLKELLTESCVE